VGDHDRVAGIGLAGRLPPGLDLALAELGESIAIPRLCLPVDLVPLDRSEVTREPTERTAGINLRELAVVADEDELGLRVGSVLGEPVDRARADHAGLIGDQHRTRSKAIALVDVDEESGDLVLSMPMSVSI
jgi:hypothetical protein